MKELLAVVTPALDESLGARYALSLAGHIAAHVTILVAEIEPEILAPVVEPDNMQGSGVAADSPTKAERVALTIELARNAAKLANASCTVLDGRSPALRDSLIDRGAAARLRDHRGTWTFALSPAGTCRRCVVWERPAANPDAR